MIQLITEAVRASIDAATTYTVVSAYDQAVNPGPSQIVVSASASPFAAGANGQTTAWKVDVTCSCITNQHDDKSGAIRKALEAVVLAWAGTVVTVAGYTHDATVDVTPQGVQTLGEEFVSAPITITMIIGKA